MLDHMRRRHSDPAMENGTARIQSYSATQAELCLHAWRNKAAVWGAPLCRSRFKGRWGDCIACMVWYNRPRCDVQQCMHVRTTWRLHEREQGVYEFRLVAC